MPNPNRYVSAIKSKTRKLNQRNPDHTGASWFSHVRKLAGQATAQARGGFSWETSRGEIRYNQALKIPLSHFFKIPHASIESYLEAIRKRNQGKVSIYLDGVGEGAFARHLRMTLDPVRPNPKTHISGGTLKKTTNTDLLLTHGILNSLNEGLAEYHRPTRRYDCVLSVYDSIHYTHQRVFVDHLLKNAAMLKKKGSLFAVVEPQQRHAAGLVSWEEARQEELALAGLEKQLKPRLQRSGFRMKVYEDTENGSDSRFIIAIQRQK